LSQEVNGKVISIEVQKSKSEENKEEVKEKGSGLKVELFNDETIDLS